MTAPQVSWSEAWLAMLAMTTVLVFVLIYYCILPCYRNYLIRKEREEEFWENDPRWNKEKFSFVPRRPADYLTDKKYSRLAACSRTSSMRSNVNNPGNEGTSASFDNEIKIVKPPKYSELYEISSRCSDSPPCYISKTPSIENNTTSSQQLLQQDNATSSQQLQQQDLQVQLPEENSSTIKQKKNRN